MKIEREIAEQLVESLSHHTGNIQMNKIDQGKFIELLVSIDIEPTSKKFYAEFPDDDKYTQVFQETRRYYYLSIRRLLVNRNVGCNVSLVKKIWGNLIFKIRWSSNVFCRGLRLNTKIRKILNESKNQFSLLAKLEIYDYDNPDEVMFVIYKPILVVPDAEGDEIETISKWEEKNTFYKKEIRFLFFRLLKRISLKKYIVCS